MDVPLPINRKPTCLIRPHEACFAFSVFLMCFASTASTALPSLSARLCLLGLPQASRSACQTCEPFDKTTRPCLMNVPLWRSVDHKSGRRLSAQPAVTIGSYFCLPTLKVAQEACCLPEACSVCGVMIPLGFEGGVALVLDHIWRATAWGTLQFGVTVLQLCLDQLFVPPFVNTGWL